MTNLNKLTEELRRIQLLLIKNLTKTLHGLMNHYDARNIWAQFLIEEVKTLQPKEEKKKMSFNSFFSLCSNEDRE